jgi:hypothetical protein
MTNERWLRWTIAKHFREKGYRINMKPVKVGKAAIDGEVIGARWKMALETKSGHDDVVRRLGKLSEAVAHGYSSGLVVSLRYGKKLDATVFSKHNLVVLGVDSKAEVHQIYP